MKNLTLFISMILLFTISCDNKQNGTDHSEDTIAIEQIITDYDKGWDSKDIDLVLAGYSDDIDWTNAFGDRVQGKDQLRDLLETIFSLDFVMAGENNYQKPDITFPNDELLLQDPLTLGLDKNGLMEAK